VCSLLCIFFLSVLLLLSFSSFAVMLNCLYPNPRVLPFSSNCPPHPTGVGGGGEKRPRGRSLLPSGAKPQHKIPRCGGKDQYGLLMCDEVGTGWTHQSPSAPKWYRKTYPKPVHSHQTKKYPGHVKKKQVVSFFLLVITTDPRPHMWTQSSWCLTVQNKGKLFCSNFHFRQNHVPSSEVLH